VFTYTYNSFTWDTEVRLEFPSTTVGSIHMSDDGQTLLTKRTKDVGVTSITRLVNGSLYRSSDGNITATEIPDIEVDNNGEHNAPLYDGEKWLVMGYYSYNGIDWMGMINSYQSSTEGSIASNGMGLYVMFGGGGGAYKTSTDGITWTDKVVSGYTGSTITIRYWNGLWVGGGASSGDPCYVLYTPTPLDGSTWGQVDFGPNSGLGFLFTGLVFLENIVWYDDGNTDGVWLCLASYNSTPILRSTDGCVSWTAQSLGGGGYDRITTGGVGGSIYVYGGSNDPLYSLDAGISWTVLDNPKDVVLIEYDPYGKVFYLYEEGTGDFVDRYRTTGGNFNTYSESIRNPNSVYNGLSTHIPESRSIGYVYQYNVGLNVWEGEKTLYNPNIQNNSILSSSRSIMMSGDGQTIVLGDVSNSCTVYEYNGGTGEWDVKQTIKQPLVSNRFSISCSITPTRIFAGSCDDRVYEFVFDTDSGMYTPLTESRTVVTSTDIGSTLSGVSDNGTVLCFTNKRGTISVMRVDESTQQWSQTTINSALIRMGTVVLSGDGNTIVGSSSTVYTDDLGVSSIVGPIFTTQRSIAYNGDVWVVVGTGGMIISRNGVEFFSPFSAPNSPNIYPITPSTNGGVFYSDVEGSFMAIGGTSGGTGTSLPSIIRSRDGYQWTTVYTTSSKNLTGIAYGNGRWIAISRYESRQTLYSDDNGDTWVEGASVLAETGAECITHVSGDNWLIGTNAPTILRSTDNGSSWGSPINLSLSSVSTIASTVSRVVAGGGGAGGIVYSDDGGVNWTPSTNSFGTPKSIKYTNGDWFGVSTGGIGGRSLDGDIWETIPDFASSNYSIPGIPLLTNGSKRITTYTYNPTSDLWDNEQTVPSPPRSGGSMALSTDGLTIGMSYLGRETAVLQGNGTRILTIGTSNTIRSLQYSDDKGVSFTQIPYGELSGLSTNTDYYSVSWDGSYWNLTSSDGLYSSTTGLEWSRTGGGGYFPLIVYGNGKRWIGLGVDRIDISSDMVLWSQVSSNSGISNPKTIAWSGTTWVIGGASTTPILYSTNDGISWSLPLAIPLTECNGLVYVDSISLWVAVGTGPVDSIATSVDGITWVGRGKSALDIGYAVSWNGTVLIAVGDGSTSLFSIATSANGTAWTGVSNSTTVLVSVGRSVSTLGDDIIVGGDDHYIGGAGTTNNTVVTSVGNGTIWSGRGLSMTSSVLSIASNATNSYFVSGETFYKKMNQYVTYTYSGGVWGSEMLITERPTRAFGGELMKCIIQLSGDATTAAVSFNDNTHILENTGSWGGEQIIQTDPGYEFFMSDDGTTIYEKQEKEVLLAVNGTTSCHIFDTDTLVWKEFTNNSINLLFRWHDHYGNGYFMLPGPTGVIIRLDPRTHETITIDLDVGVVVDDMAYGNKTWVATTNDGMLVSNDDWASWTITTAPSVQNAVQNVTYINGPKWVLIDNYERYISTDNAMTFTNTGVTVINGVYSQLGAKVIHNIEGVLFFETPNGLLRSTDEGITWAPTPPTNTHSNLRYSNGLYIVIGNTVGSTLAVSFNGVDWVDTDYIYGGGKLSYSETYGVWFLSGLGYSYDGLVWDNTSYPSSTNMQLSRVSFSNRGLNRMHPSVYRVKDGLWRKTHTLSTDTSFLSSSADGVNVCSSGGLGKSHRDARNYHLISAGDTDRLYETQTISYVPLLIRNGPVTGGNPHYDLYPRATLISNDASTLVVHNGKNVKIYKK
jgi:hypothetical protein